MECECSVCDVDIRVILPDGRPIVVSCREFTVHREREREREREGGRERETEREEREGETEREI